MNISYTSGKVLTNFFVVSFAPLVVNMNSRLPNKSKRLLFRWRHKGTGDTPCSICKCFLILQRTLLREYSFLQWALHSSYIGPRIFYNPRLLFERRCKALGCCDFLVFRSELLGNILRWNARQSNLCTYYASYFSWLFCRLDGNRRSNESLGSDASCATATFSPRVTLFLHCYWIWAFNIVIFLRPVRFATLAFMFLFFSFSSCNCSDGAVQCWVAFVVRLVECLSQS